LQTKNAEVEEREYGKTPLFEIELCNIIGDEPIENFLNTRTPLYRQKNLKQQPPSKDAAIKLMLSDQNLFRRPIFIKGNNRLLGFDETAVKTFI